MTFDVDSLTESTVDKYSYDDVVAPPESERRVEDVRVGDGSMFGNDVQRRAVIDIPRRITVVDDVDRDEAVERARRRIGTVRLSSAMPDTADYRDDLPPIGEHVYEREQVGMNDTNLRSAVRYWIEDVDVAVVDE